MKIRVWLRHSPSFYEPEFLALLCHVKDIYLVKLIFTTMILESSKYFKIEIKCQVNCFSNIVDSIFKTFRRKSSGVLQDAYSTRTISI